MVPNCWASMEGSTETAGAGGYRPGTKAGTQVIARHGVGGEMGNTKGEQIRDGSRRRMALRGRTRGETWKRLKGRVGGLLELWGSRTIQAAF